MSSHQIATPDIGLRYPTTSVALTNEFSISNSNQADPNKYLPNSLVQLANFSAWRTVKQADLVLPGTGLTDTNLFLENYLAKSDNPNTVFAQARVLLPSNGFFAFKIITAENIKKRLRSQYPQSVFSLYYPVHFLVHRVSPKLKGFRKVCRLLGVSTDISKAEIIGRLIYTGFTIVDIQEASDETVFIARPNLNRNPSETLPPPKEGFMFTMKRLGKGGQEFLVYKFRSMHPYAEYVQEYLYKQNGLDKGGKFKDDFRVSTGGRVIRKYWIDELPMLINLLRGELKLVGVRPISSQYFSLYPAELQQLRQKHIPGLIPPFYADLPETFDEIVNSEITYLRQYEERPYQTDLRYFLKIVNNIIFRRARSK